MALLCCVFIPALQRLPRRPPFLARVPWVYLEKVAASERTDNVTFALLTKVEFLNTLWRRGMGIHVDDGWYSKSPGQMNCNRSSGSRSRLVNHQPASESQWTR